MKDELQQAQIASAELAASIHHTLCEIDEANAMIFNELNESFESGKSTSNCRSRRASSSSSPADPLMKQRRRSLIPTRASSATKKQESANLLKSCSFLIYSSTASTAAVCEKNAVQSNLLLKLSRELTSIKDKQDTQENMLFALTKIAR